MSSQPRTFVARRDYLNLERQAEFRSEYLDGEIIAMTGASRRHNLIVVNLARDLTLQLKGKPCEVYANDMRVKVPSARLYAYPDVVVVCGQPQFEDDHVDTLLNPTLIIEVLSASTEAYDRGKKFSFYRTLDSLYEYLLVAQDEYRIEQYVKQTDGRWLLSEAGDLAETVQISSAMCALSLKEVYDRVIIE